MTIRARIEDATILCAVGRPQAALLCTLTAIADDLGLSLARVSQILGSNPDHGPRTGWSERRRTMHAAAVTRWHHEHPAKLKVIQQRVQMVRRLVARGMEREAARREARKCYPLPPEAA